MTWEVPDVRQFCGVDRLQITCLRRSENPFGGYGEDTQIRA